MHSSGGTRGTCAEPFTEALLFSPMLPFVLETSREELGRYLSLGEAVGGGRSSGGGPQWCFLPGISVLLQEIYRETNDNHSGSIDTHEMRTALRNAGEDVSCR